MEVPLQIALARSLRVQHGGVSWKRWSGPCSSRFCAGGRREGVWIGGAGVPHWRHDSVVPSRLLPGLCSAAWDAASHRQPAQANGEGDVELEDTQESSQRAETTAGAGPLGVASISIASVTACANTSK